MNGGGRVVSSFCILAVFNSRILLSITLVSCIGSSCTGLEGFRILRQPAHKGGKVVSTTYLPPLPSDISAHIGDIQKANLVLEFMGILFKFRISCTVFFVLKVYGKGISSLTFFFRK
jgi:hypothetical protein